MATVQAAQELVPDLIDRFGKDMESFEKEALQKKHDVADYAKFQYLSNKISQQGHFVTNILKAMHDLHMAYIQHLKSH